MELSNKSSNTRNKIKKKNIETKSFIKKPFVQQNHLLKIK